MDEVMEFDLAEWIYPPEIEKRLRDQLPAGIELVSATPANPHKAAQGKEVVYRLAPRPGSEAARRLTVEALDRVMGRTELPVRRLRKGKEKIVDVRPFLLQLRRDEEVVEMTVKAGPEGSTRPEEILGALGLSEDDGRSCLRVVRAKVLLAD